MRECSLICAVHELAIACEERNHLTIPRLVRLFVKWPSDKKQRPSFARSLPTRPWTTAVAEASFEPQAVHNGAVERESPLEVCDAYEDVRKHYRLPWVEYRRLTFDLSGVPKARPLEGRVSRHFLAPHRLGSSSGSSSSISPSGSTPISTKPCLWYSLEAVLLLGLCIVRTRVAPAAFISKSASRSADAP